MVKNGSKKLGLSPFENAPSILIKPFSGRHAALHAGGIRVSIRVGIRVVMVQRIRARCHSTEVRMVTRMKSRTWPFLHVSVLQYCLQCATVPGPENAVFGVNFVLHCVVELPGLL